MDVECWLRIAEHEYRHLNRDIMDVECWVQIALMSIFMLVLETRFWLEAKLEALGARLLKLKERCAYTRDTPTVVAR